PPRTGWRERAEEPHARREIHARIASRSTKMSAWVSPNRARVFQTPRNDGHVLECGGVPPLLRKTLVSFRPRLRRRSKSGGAPPHSKTQAKLDAAVTLNPNPETSSGSASAWSHPPEQIYPSSSYRDRERAPALCGSPCLTLPRPPIRSLPGRRWPLRHPAR